MTARQSNASSITESLEQLADASQRLADLAAKAIGLDVGELTTENPPDVDLARTILTQIFSPETIEGYDGSESMERARVAHFNAAMEMYMVMAVDINTPEESLSSSDLATRIGNSLLRELKDYYRMTIQGNTRITFTTEQRTALESAFLLKPKLNTAEKRALAQTCNLNPRQVEVWFSNRRTRKKRDETRQKRLTEGNQIQP